METMTTLTGGCLCGRTRYALKTNGELLDGYYCHCRMCQLAFGNTRAAFVNVRKEAVYWTGEPPALYASSKIARRGFCPTCGTPLSFEYADSERMDLSIGSLDDPSRVQPTSHFAVETRIERWHVPDGLRDERFDEHKKLLDRWRQAYGDEVEPGIDAARVLRGW